MSTADVFIAFGLPGLVAGLGLFALAYEQRGEARKARLIRQSVEIRLAFGEARAELFRLAAEGVVAFNSDIYRALYTLDTMVMRDLDSHTSLAVAMTDVLRRRDAMADEQAQLFRAFALAPATAECARLHANAVEKLWLEHSVLAQRLRMVPRFLLPASVAALRGLAGLLSGVGWLLRLPGRWAEERRTRPKVAELVQTLDPGRPPLGLC